jgi:hypothetical protein
MSAILIVEGHDEEALVEKLSELHGLSIIEIINAKGIDGIDPKFQKSLKAAIAGSAVTHIAILRDAEEEPLACKALLEQYREQILQSPSPEILYEYLILPNDSTAGSLETFLLPLIAPDDSLLNCAQKFVECVDNLPPNTHKLTTQARKDKARFLIRQYAAVGKSSGIKSLLEKDQINLSSPIFNPIVELLKRLSSYNSVVND